jgi:AcrR family transcriptional regulator
LHLRRWSA